MSAIALDIPRNRRWSWLTPVVLGLIMAMGLLVSKTKSSGGGGPPDLTCDDSSGTTTSAGLDSFLDGIASGGASANDPRVLCLTATTITLTSQVNWTVPDHVILIGNGGLSTMGGDDGSTTTFVDNFNPQPGGNCGSACDTLRFTSIDGYFRFAGFTYQGPNGNTIRDNAPITFGGDSTQLRIDHFTYDAEDATDQVHWMVIGGCLRGVIDHSVWVLPNDIAWIHFVNGSCGDSTGDHAWADATDFGSDDFFFFEDSTWTVPSGGTSLGTLTDCHTGGKFVIRFSTVGNTSIGQTHATIHGGGDDRGCRAHEIYGNQTDDDSNGANDPSFALTEVLSGGALIWGNTWENNVYERAIEVENCRIGTNCGYTPSPTPGNWGPCGTAYSGSDSDWDRNDDSTGYACIDQAGRGQGDLLTGSAPNKVNSQTGIISYPDQALEPVYEWLNTGTTTGLYFRNGGGPQVQNRDYYVYRGNSSCNAGAGSCTAGVGSGTLAQRPANCTTGSETGGGVAYWATDQGSWNTSSSNPEGVDQSGADGVLYRCSATNTWVTHYTPYTYPHPLNN